jgi:hypothetical protein
MSTLGKAAITEGVELLAHIREAFLNADKIHTSTLLQRLCGREESPWADIRGKSLTGGGLAKMLKNYEIKSTQMKISGVNLQGYYRADFEDAWKRHVDPIVGGDPTDPTFLNSKNNLVGALGSVGSGTAETADIEPEESADIIDFEERAASLQYDAGLDRDEAEAQAALQTRRRP